MLKLDLDGAVAAPRGEAPIGVKTAGQVGDVTKEMIGLYYDRQNAALKQQWAKLELREMTLRKMLEVDRLIKAGRFGQAGELSKKLRQFCAEHQAEIGDTTVGETLNTLDQNLDKARYKQSALNYLNEARRPYDQALRKYQRRQSPRLAQEEALEARKILQTWLPNYLNVSQAMLSDWPGRRLLSVSLSNGAVP